MIVVSFVFSNIKLGQPIKNMKLSSIQYFRSKETEKTLGLDRKLYFELKKCIFSWLNINTSRRQRPTELITYSLQPHS